MRVMSVVAGALAATTMVVAPRDTQAGVRFGVGILIGHDHGHGYGYGRGDASRYGFDRGLRDGYDHGAKDGRHNESFDFVHDRRYRHGDAGYERWCGPKWDYVAGYRRGYEQGYRRAYSEYRWASCPPRYDDRYGYRDQDRDDDDDVIYEQRDRRRY